MRIVLVGIILLLGLAAQAQPPYQERYRPQFHFSPEKNWMNDPNGLIYFQGEYHLFYQHNPLGNKWGHMSWGHAVSKDLVHWEHLDIALPEKWDRMAFSGCVVADRENSAGLQSGADPTLVAVYTGYRQSDGWQAQYLAYSNDRGRTWQDYSDEPVLDISSTDFRDPNVFRYNDEWRMVIALPTERKVQIYSSKDLRNWDFLSEFGPHGAVGGAWECPDLFPLQVEGEDITRWVLQVDLDRKGYCSGSGGQYFVGDFDGEKFTLDNPIPGQVWPEGRSVAGHYDISGTGIWQKAEGKCGSTRGALGTARSTNFVIDKPWLNFEIRGGRHPGTVEARLVVDDRIVQRTTGFNGSNPQPISWNLTKWQGRNARMELADRSNDLWGHLEISRTTLSDYPVQESKFRARWVDYGPDYYACISFHNLEKRRVWLAWMNNWLYGQDIPTDPWRSSMSLPREVSLRRFDDSIVLCQRPVKEVSSLRAQGGKLVEADFSEIHTMNTDLNSNTGEIMLRWDSGGGKSLEWKLLGLRYEVDLEAQELIFYRGRGQVDFHESFPITTRIPISVENGEWEARIFYDVSSVELFAQDGRLVHTARTFPQDDSSAQISLQSDAGFVALKHWTFKSIW